MIVYPAGPQWTRTFETALTASELANRLCEAHGFTEATLYEPFGHGRGAVIARRGHLLVMAPHTDGTKTWFALALSNEMQDLLWSFSNGYASQWTTLELKLMSGCDNWEALLVLAGKQFAGAESSVDRAIQGMPASVPAALAEMPPFEGDCMELPPDYLQSVAESEVIECAH